MATQLFYARTREDDDDPEHWQTLADHLAGVADRATSFAGAFESAEWGRLAGLWHDLGKYLPEFQRKLRGERVDVKHSGLGAVLAVEKHPMDGFSLAFAIAGHHAGLANPVDGHDPSPLKDRLKQNAALLARVRPVVPLGISDRALPALPGFLAGQPGISRNDGARLRRSWELWVRFLFSALVDADRLDSEAFKDPAKATIRGQFAAIPELRDRLDQSIDGKVAALPPDVAAGRVNRARAEVLRACRTAGELPPGFFSLTVPTGGGKTLSAMSFALRHAERHGLRRVIVVIPYTSIIEQNAKVYYDALGARNVIEHHSNFDDAKQRKEHGEDIARPHDLACENWDAPVIVTTTVQFFESLFSNRPSRCRKLHNVARSVIVLDEVQTLPPEFLLPILEGLNELVAHYGCSVVLSTATPPALKVRERFDYGLKGVRPIVLDPTRLGADLRRVDYSWPEPEAEPPSWEDLAAELAAHPQVLAVVHRRNDARMLAQLLAAHVPEVVHLSALMCPAHRSDVLARVRTTLARGEPCRVVSTQLVEAGVDLDFPVVYRALGGLDSIVQAAGRCNREGRTEKGRVIVFRAPTDPPRGTPQKALDATLTMLRAASPGKPLDMDDPGIFEEYFRTLYSAERLDARSIQSAREQFNFATVGASFRLIEDEFTRAVVVPWGDVEVKLQTLRDALRKGTSRDNLRTLFRALQPFTVSIHVRAFDRLAADRTLEEVAEGVFAIIPTCRHLYDETFGLVTGDEAHNPESLIA